MKGQITKRFSRRAIVFFWLAFVTLVLGLLIYFERIDALYILATLGLVALLAIVAFADLENITFEGDFKDV